MKRPQHRLSKAVLLGLVPVITTLYVGSARAQGATEPGPSVVRQRLYNDLRPTGIALSDKPVTTLGLDGYAALGVLGMSGKVQGHAVVGAQLRLKLNYFELGGGIEQSDYKDEEWRQIHGFFGASLPFTNWVALEGDLGFAVRRYHSRDTRYGPDGANVSLPSLLFRVGISDRPAAGILGARISAALFTQVDLSTRDMYWEYRLQGVVINSGTTTFGGTTIGMLFDVGFDLSLKKAREFE